MKETPSDPPVLDLAQLRQFTAGDAALEAEVFELFLTNGDKYLVEIAAAGTGQARKIVAHALKGSARVIGARRVEALAQRIEDDPEISAAALARQLADLRAALDQVARAIDEIE